MNKACPTVRIYWTFLLGLFSVNAVALTDGYILAGAYSGTSTVLLDKNGEVVWEWKHGTLPDSLNGYSAYLLENGHLLRSSQVPNSRDVKVPPNAAPRQGIISELDANGTVVWTYTLANDTFMLHHDMKPLPPRNGATEGTILATTFSLHTRNEMKEVGVDTTLLKTGSNFILAEKIIEIKKVYPSGGEIIWEWSIFDHVTPGDSAALHPEKISGSIVSALFSGQWVHLNGLDYSPTRDLIVFTSRIFSELYVLDHSTTTEEAAGSTGGRHGKGGDILYRWGNPANYGATGGVTIDCLHSPTWIPEGYKGAGNILFFHNNLDAGHSEVIEINPPLDAEGKFVKESDMPFGPETPYWKYAPESDFFSQAMSSTMRMPGAEGHTIIHEAYPPAAVDPSGGPGFSMSTDSRIREVTSDGTIVDSFSLTALKSGGGGMMMAFNPAKIMYYPGNYAGVANLMTAVRSPEGKMHVGVSSTGPAVRRFSGKLEFSGLDGEVVSLVNLRGECTVSVRSRNAWYTLPTDRIPTGVYCVMIAKRGVGTVLQKITIAR